MLHEKTLGKWTPLFGKSASASSKVKISAILIRVTAQPMVQSQVQMHVEVWNSSIWLQESNAAGQAREKKNPFAGGLGFCNRKNCFETSSSFYISPATVTSAKKKLTNNPHLRHRITRT